MLAGLTLTVLLSLPPTPPSPELDQLAQRFTAALAADDIRAFDELSGQPTGGGRWRSVKELVERYECISVKATAVRLVEPNRAEITIDGVARTAGTPRRPVILPAVWHVELVRENDRWRMESVETAERALARRLFAAPPDTWFRAVVDRPELDHDELLRELVAINVVQPWDAKTVERFADVAAVARGLGDLPLEAHALRFHARVAGIMGASEAAWATERALATAQRSGSPDALADALFIAGMEEWRTGRVDAAEQSILRAVEMIDQLDDPRIAIKAMRMATALAEREGELRRVLPLAGREIELAVAYGWPEGQVNGLLAQAFVKARLGDGRLHLQLLLQARALASRIGYDSGYTIATVNAATSHADSGEFDRAVQMLREVLADRHRPLMVERNNIELLLTYALVRTGSHLEEAECLLAELLAAPVKDPRMLMAAAAQFSQLRLKQGRLDEALDLAERAVSAGRVSTFDGPLLMDPWTAPLARARALRALQRVDEAEETFRETVGIIEEKQADLAGAGFRTSGYLSTVAAVYREYAELLVSIGDVEGALGIADAAKGRTIVSALEPGSGEVRKEIDESDRRTEAALTERVEQLNRALEQTTLRSERDRVGAQRDTARTALSVLQTTLALKYPRLRVAAAERRVDPLSEAAAVPRKGEVILEYLVGDQSSLVFVLARTPNGVEVSARNITAGRSTIQTAVNELLLHVSSRSIHSTRSARRLYDLLIAPAEDRVRRAEVLRIIPDDVLWRLPFQALVDSEGNALISRMPISYAVSLAALRLAQSRGPRPARARSVFAVANGTALSTRLPPLPEAAAEAQAVARMYPRASVTLGAEARESDFKQRAPDFSILHIATHAVVSDASPMYSAIVLAPSEEEDGLLEAREIAELRLNADLAVLSGCDTARADSHRGDGMVGLSWAFLVAGCPTTVASLWQAQSAATEKLMRDFHRHLLAGETPALALRKAQLRLMREPRYQDPLYWAPFVVIGGGG